MKCILSGVALASLSIAVPSSAAPKNAASTFSISQAEKERVRSYSLDVFLPQTTLETSFDTGRVASPPSGGLFDTLIVRRWDDKKQIMGDALKEKAEQTVTPLRKVLTDFEVDAMALASSEKALAAVPWIARERTRVLKSSLPPPSNSNVAQIRYTYDISPDFTAIRVFAEVNLLQDCIVKIERGRVKCNGFYGQSITSIVQLRKRSYEGSDNVAAWSAENGKQAKAAFTQAFGQIEQLIPFALGLGEKDIKNYGAKDHEQAFAAGYNGALIKRGGASADDVLIYNKGLLHVHTLP